MNIDCDRSSRLGLYRFLSRFARLFLAIGMLPFALPVQARLATPAYPVIFIHGINSNASTWGKFSSVLTENGWSSGGTVSLGENSIVSGSLAPADFYKLNFSSSFGLTFFQQGAELAAIISAVVAVNSAANPTKNKVILVAHSMGGLAARAYLQSQAGALYKDRGDVAALITVGTPHQGSMEAERCLENSSCSKPQYLSLSALYSQAFMHPDSVAFNALVPESKDLNTLNRNVTSLPTSVRYVVPVGKPLKRLPGEGWPGFW